MTRKTPHKSPPPCVMEHTGGLAGRLAGAWVFYYWKRKYKYIMARWGYSVNLAVIEPFNEIDQMLTYQDHNLDTSSSPTLCPENKLHWPVDPDLPGTINQWLTDIMAYVRDPVDTAHPASSPLGEDKKLFLMSYTDRYQPGDQETPTGFFQPFDNPKLDIVDVHHSPRSGDQELRNSFDLDQNFHDHFHPAGIKKPFHNGEFETIALKDVDGDSLHTQEYDTGQIFDNYDVSFHNEIWASTFFGNFAAGTSWAWQRVFWWPDAQPTPPHDSGNPFPANPFQQFSNVLGATNIVDVDGDSIPVVNRSVYHNFKPLTDLLSNPDVQSYDFFNWDFTPQKVYDETHKIECYYLVNEGTMAIGWVHNLNAYWENHYYVRSDLQNFLGCTSPVPHTVELPGFFWNHDFYITWFPTRMNDTIHPVDTMETSITGTLTLDMGSAPLGGTLNNYLDTLHTDYAFVISLSPVHRSMTYATETDTTSDSGWNFGLYPNPADDQINVALPDDRPKNIAIHDLSGRQVRYWSSVSGPLLRLPIGQLSRGVYYVRVTDGAHSRVKELIIR